ncbi:hypothetical protein CEE86_12655, partial [Lactobacillus crispatus]
MVDPPGIAGQVAAAMHRHQLQVGKARQRSAEDQVVQRQRGFERVADHVVEIEMGEAVAMGKSVGMHH